MTSGQVIAMKAQGPAIVQWVHLCLPTCGPGFEFYAPIVPYLSLC